MLHRFFPLPYLPKISNLHYLKNHLGVTEKFVQVSGYDKYYISDHGRVFVRSHIKVRAKDTRYFASRMRKLTEFKDRKNYHRVGLDGKMHFVHRLVASAFCVKPPGCDIVDHRDGNGINNHYTNLRWVTERINAQENHKQNVLDMSLATIIRQECELTGDGASALSKKFDIKRTTVYKVIANHTWYDSNWCGITRKFL